MVHGILTLEYQRKLMKSRALLSYEARKEYKKLTGKEIPTGYVIHHDNNNPYENSEENLKCIPEEIHRYIHAGYKHINEIWYKYCEKCQDWKPLDSFYRLYYRRSSLCKKCHNKMRTIQRKKNKIRD